MTVATNQNAIEDIKKLGDIIKDIKFAMVTTENPQGSLQSCPLTTQQVEFDGDLWFIVGRSSELVKNIQNKTEVNASFSSAKGNYVSISGNARLVEDRMKLEELWTEAYKIWFKEGINDPNIGLLKIDVTDAEYWDSPGSAVVKMAAFAKAYITGDPKSLGEHHKVHLN
jgi:general stress protein 26